MLVLDGGVEGFILSFGAKTEEGVRKAGGMKMLGTSI